MYELFFLPPNNSVFFFQNHGITPFAPLTFYKNHPKTSLTFYKKTPISCLTFYKNSIFVSKNKEI